MEYLIQKEAKNIEQWSKSRGRKISKDQLLGEGEYATVERQAEYDSHTLDLCHTAASNTWDRIGEIEKIIEPFTKVIQNPKEVFIGFFF